MEFTLLGHVRAELDGVAVPLGRRQERCLLGLLLLEPGRTVPTARLADLLWDDQPPAAARGVIQTYIARLRARLSPHGPRVSGGAAGYGVHVDPRSVDVHRFRELVASADHLEDPAERARTLAAALALWNGPPLADVASDHLRTRIGSAFQELRLVAAERYAEAELASGSPDRAIAVLVEFAGTRPIREQLVNVQMRAYAAAGRTEEALAAYRSTRDALVEDLGIEPGADLRALHEQILRGDTAMTPGPPVVANGVQPRGPRELPPAVRAFTGRQLERERVAQTVMRGRGSCVLISGRAGVGKSALAVRVAHDVMDQFPDGQIYIDLCGTSPGLHPRTAGDALSHSLRSLGVAPAEIPRHEAEAAARLRSLTNDRRILFVLDNARNAVDIAPLIPSGSGCSTIVTGRTRLIGLDADACLELTGLDHHEATELITRISRRPSSAAFQRVIDMCEGLPLALRIAAARLAGQPELSVEELAERLADQRHRLDELDLEGLAVRRSIQASVEALRDSPAPPDRFAAWLFPWLAGVPVETVTTDLAASMAAQADIGTVRLAMRRLADLHLLYPAGVGRYAMHDLVRLYAREHRAAALSTVDQDGGVERGLNHYLLTIQRLHEVLLPSRDLLGGAIPGREGVMPATVDTAEQANAWLSAELSNIVAAARHALTGPPSQPSFPLQAARALHWLLGKRAAWAEESTLADLAVQATVDGSTADHVDALRLRGQASLHMGRVADAIPDLESAAQISRDADDLKRFVSCLADLARAALLSGDAPLAQQRLEHGLAIARAQGWRGTESILLVNLSDVHAASHDWEAALRALRASLELGTGPADPARLAIALPALGHLCFELGEVDDALSNLGEGLALCRAVGNEVDGWFAAVARAVVHLASGSVRPSLHDAVAAWRYCSDARPYETAVTLLLISHVTRYAGHEQIAESYLRRGDSAYSRYSGPRNPSVESLMVHASAISDASRVG